MARTLRGRRASYDNIAAGSATGTERTIADDTVSKVEMYGGGFRTSTSNAEEWHSNVQQGNVVTDQGATNIVGDEIAERIVATATTNTEERLTP